MPRKTYVRLVDYAHNVVLPSFGRLRGVGARRRFQERLAQFPAYLIAEAEAQRMGDPYVNQWGTGLTEFRGRWKGLFAPINPDRELALFRFDGAVVATPPGRNYSATLSGFSAYRQLPAIPDVGTVHGWNLVKNGGFQSGADFWTLHANASVVVDATSPTGYAVRLVATAANQFTTSDMSIEAARAFASAAQVRSDGSMIAYAELQWLDESGTPISSGYGSTTSAAYTEIAVITNVTAPGNARSARIRLYSNGAGTAYFTAIRVKQQATAPLAWSSADQQTLGNKGLVVYEGTTNNGGTDSDMETAGVANYAATTATLTKTTTNPFAGTQRLTVTNTAANGYAAKTGSLAAGQAITASVRCIGADAGAGIKLVSTPGGTTIGTDFAATTDWAVRKVSGTIAVGDTGWEVRLVGGSGAAVVSHFDNLGIENKAYNTLNSGDGQEFTTTTRTASSDTESLPDGFNIGDFGRTIPVRFDHAYNAHSTVDRWLWCDYIDASNYIGLLVNASDGSLRFRKVRAGVTSEATDGAATALAAGDAAVIAVRHSATVGLEFQVAKNGGAAVTYSSATAEAKTPLSGTPTRYLGRFGTAGNEPDATIGIDRLYKSNQSAAYLTAVMGMVS